MIRSFLATLLFATAASAVEPVITKGTKSLPLPGESFKIDGHEAFVVLPPGGEVNIPWVWYAPTLDGLPAQSEVWMFKQFLAKGIAIAGIDVGESFGSPSGSDTFSAFYDYLVKQRQFRKKPCLLARSRGGLMLYSWAIDHPKLVGGIAGIYPVCNIASYPGLAKAAGAYGLTAEQLKSELTTHNPIDRLKPLAQERVPILHIHGDSDQVVPLAENSGELGKRYSALGGPAEIMVIEGQGHNMWEGWFQSQKLTDFAIAQAIGQPLHAAPTPDLHPRPVAHWKLDDNGDVARDAVGLHHGKIVGAFAAPGKIGQSLEFVRNKANHVVIPYAEDFALSTFTVSAWVYLTREPTFSGILGTRHGGDQTFDIKVNAAKVHGDIGDGTNWIETAVNFYADDTGTNGEGGDLALQRWYHIAYVIDNTNKECRLYLDADVKKRITFKGDPILMTPANTMQIGHSSATEFMDGRIDDVKIWNLALTPEQIQAEWAAAEPIDFAHQIVPILRTHCATCHGGRENEGDFSINTRADVLDSGFVDIDDADSSHLMELITSDDPDVQMPPSDRPRISTEQVTLIRRWIESGLDWDDDLSFEVLSYEPPLRPRTVELPPADGQRNHPIDRILDAYLNANGLPQPEPISDEAFLRRACLDLVGLLPTTAQFREMQNGSATNRRLELIDNLLESKIAYAEHWLTFFNDLLRNDYSGTGFITGGRRQISKWLHESLVANKPFDQMVRELVNPPSAESRGYIDGIRWRGTVSAGQTVEIQFSQSISQSFLGINMKCASCHDSFIDRWTLKQAYGLGAIYAENPMQLHRCDKPTGEQQAASWLFPELGKIDASAPRDERLRQLSLLMTDTENGRFARTIVNRLWYQLMGRGIVHPIDAMQSKPWSEDLLDYLAGDLVRNGYDLKRALRLIATSQAYQSTTEAADQDTSVGDAYVYRGPRPRRMTAEQFLDAIWQLTDAAPNEYDAPIVRQIVPQSEIDLIQLSGDWIWGPLDQNRAPGGQTLLVRKTIDLPANVVQGGAVVTCDNEFTLYIGNREVASGNEWTKPQAVLLKGKLKKGKNEIVLRVKNLLDQANPAGLFFEARVTLADGSTQSIVSDATWQYNEQVPHVGEGRLAPPRKGWEPVILADALSVWTDVIEKQGRTALASVASSHGSEPRVRASLLKNTPLMQSLGRPGRDQIVSMRPIDLTTLEAIDLANESTLAASLKKGGQRWADQEWESTTAMVDKLFLASLTRSPTAEERDLFVEFLGDQPNASAISDAIWAIGMLPEFLLIR